MIFYKENGEVSGYIYNNSNKMAGGSCDQEQSKSKLINVIKRKQYGRV